MRYITGLVFIFSAIAKIISLQSFELYVFSFELASFDLCSIAARVLIATELILGLGMILNIYRKPVVVLSILLTLAFSGFLLWRVLAGDSRSCHCFGEIVDLNPVQSLVKNAILIVLLIFAYKPEPKGRFWAWINKYKLYFILGIVPVSLCIPFVVSPPDMFFRNNESDSLVYDNFKETADSLGLNQGKRLVCFYSYTCPHCRHCAMKLSEIISRNSLPQDSISVIFMQTSTKQDSLVKDFYKQFQNGMELPYSYLHPYNFIPMTNGVMPIIIALEDGKLVKEYDYLTLSEKELRDFFDVE